MKRGRNKFIPAVESLECEGFISLEEVDPSCLIFDTKQKPGTKNEWSVTECVGSAVDGSKKMKKI